MEKIWFIQVNGHQEGPYSFLDLKRHPSLTPDTLIWREGFEKWVPIRKVHELKDLFKDDPQPEEQPENKQKKEKTIRGKEELVIDIRRDPPFIVWVLIGLIIISYLIYKAYVESW